MKDVGEGEFLDLLYGAAVVSDQWITVMENLADLVGGTSAFLSRLDVVTGAGTGLIARIDPLMPSLYLEHYAGQNLLSKTSDVGDYIRNWRPCILTDEDWLPKESLVNSEYYNDFLRPQDIHSVLMIRLAIDGQTPTVLNLHRSRAQEQFGGECLETVRRLHPHLIRAFGLGEKLMAHRQLDEDASSVYETSSNALFLTDKRARVLRLNRAAEVLVCSGAGFSLRGGMLSVRQAAAARRLEGLLAAAASDDPARRTGGSMAIFDPARRLPFSVTVTPLRPERTFALHAAAHALICVSDPQADLAVPGQHLRELFGLTPAEIRVASALFAGDTAKQAAARLGVSPHTVHVHVTRIFEKTGVKRQSELMRMMMQSASSIRQAT